MSEYSEIDYQTAINFVLPKHYSGRKPSIKYAFGEYRGPDLIAVCIFGIPATHFLCASICGEEMQDNVIELNRLCRVDTYDGILSKFVAWCLKQIGDKIVVSYADTAMNHHGYIYQALNFLFTGKTDRRTDNFSVDNPSQHARHARKDNEYRQVRSPKYRYVLFVGSKKFKKLARSLLTYPIEPYPKGDNNTDYALGDFLIPTVIDRDNNVIDFSEPKTAKIDDFF